MSSKDSDDSRCDSPWYQAGLRFGCTRSGRCCSNHGDHAYVYLLPAEVEALAGALEMTPRTFQRKYTHQENGWTLLTVEGSSCVFQGEGGQCEVYSARPVQCRTWPFWRENIASQEAWEGIVQSVCAGAGCGILYSPERIQHIANCTEDWYEERIDVLPASAQVGHSQTPFPPPQSEEE